MPHGYESVQREQPWCYSVGRRVKVVVEAKPPGSVEHVDEFHVCF